MEILWSDRDCSLNSRDFLTAELSGGLEVRAPACHMSPLTGNLGLLPSAENHSTQKGPLEAV
jgi:hypothetical protein